MKWRDVSLSLALAAALLFVIAPECVAQTQFGPRGNLTINYYATDAAAWTALTTGAIDIMAWPLTPAQYAAAFTTPTIRVAPVQRFDVYAFSLNCNETIGTCAGVKNPLTIPEFRKAIHRLSDRDSYVNAICGGFATKLPVAIAAPAASWWNTSVVDFVEGTVNRYPWPYDSLTFSKAAANALLDTAGFTDLEPDNIRNYPASWPGRPGRPNLDPIVFVIRSDDTLIRTAGQNLAQQMQAVGIPVNLLIVPFATAYTLVMVMHNYHIYTACWGVDRFPTYLYSWFHSSCWFPGGSNYHLSPYGQGGLPDQSLIDLACLRLRYPATYSDAMEVAKYLQYLLHEKFTVIVPLWSSRSFYAYDDDLLGITNVQCGGLDNIYTYLKAWKTTGAGTIFVGTRSPPQQVNQIYSRWSHDVATMDPFMADFLSAAPYTIMVDQPWLVQDWTSPPQTWLDEGVEKSKMTFWFRDDPSDGLGDRDAEWIAPVTGTVLADFAPQWLEGGGYEFNCWYYASEPAGWIYSNYKDIHHIRIYPTERKAEVYFNVKSFWSIYWACGRLIYAPAWKVAPLSTLQTVIFPGPIPSGTSLDLPYRNFGAPVEIVDITRSDGQPYNRASGASDNDYEMVNGRIKLYTTIAAGVSVTVNYWARGDPAGYAPGNLFVPPAIGSTWIGAGPFYVTAHTPGAGGSTTYTKNPEFFLETPPEGEIDFWWNWVYGPQPRDGYYRVDTLDLSRSCWGLDGIGSVPPSKNWLPETDLTWPGGTEPKGKTTDHDNTVVASDNGKIFGSSTYLPSF